jgi:hypothetical protein
MVIMEEKAPVCFTFSSNISIYIFIYGLFNVVLVTLSV